MSPDVVRISGPGVSIGEAEVAAHAADTTSVHGISDTALLALDSATARLRFVIPAAGGGSDASNGRSWGRAKATIEAAAADLPDGGTIFLAPGDYSPAATVALGAHRIVGTMFAPSGYPGCVIHHNFDGDLFSFAAGSQGIGLEHLYLNQEAKGGGGDFTGAAIKASSSAGTAGGYMVCRNLICTGAGGFQRNVHLDGSANASGFRTTLFENCSFFGAYTAGENVLLNKVVGCRFDKCAIILAPAAVTQGLKILNAFSDYQWVGGVLGDVYSEAAGDGSVSGGGLFQGYIGGVLTYPAGSAGNVFRGPIVGPITNAGTNNKIEPDPTPAAHVTLNANESIAHDTGVTIPWDVEAKDTNAMVDLGTSATTITVKTPGEYVVTLNLAFASNATGFRSAHIVLNGTHAASSVVQAVNGSETRMSVTRRLGLNVSDAITAVVYQNSGGALTVTSVGANAYSANLEVVKVG